MNAPATPTSVRPDHRAGVAHSSLTPFGVNAVQVAYEIVTYLTSMARAFRDNGAFMRRLADRMRVA